MSKFARMNSKKRISLSIGVGIAISVATLVYMVSLMPSRLTLFHVQYFEENDKPRLVLFFVDVPYSEDSGNYLDGYKIKLIDPAENKEIANTYVNRYMETPPPWPQVRFYGTENIWLIQTKQFIQGDTGYIKKLKLFGDQFIEENPPSLKGYIPEQVWGKQHLLLKNKFNETYCLDIKYAQVSPGNCPQQPNEYDTITCAFLMASKELGSVRYKIYFYETSQPDPMKITAGINQKQSLLYNLWFNRNKTTQQQLDEYQKTMQSHERIVAINTSDYLISPQCVYKSRDKAIYIENNIDKKQTRYHCFGRNGETYWTLNNEKFNLKNPQTGITCISYRSKFIFWSFEWVFAVDAQTGKMLWYYNP
jgi:outer membrane protein assembly factor BamB